MNLEAFGYACFGDLEKLKQKSTTWIKNGRGKMIFDKFYAIWQKGDIVL